MTDAPGDPDAPDAPDARVTPDDPGAGRRATRPPSSRLNREILALAVPSFLSTISVPLVGIADTALVGRLGPVAYIGAVAIGSVLFDTLYWAFGFLRMGTTALVAQAYGAGDDRRCGEILIQSALLALVVGMAMIALRDPAITIGLRLAGGSPEVQEWARAYMLVRILGAPAVILTYALHG
ncbi:MAG: MATE family efflux transporter, partial [Candidatus Eiseniibacteriota bacterium]